MHEIVIVRNCYFEAGCSVYGDRLIEAGKASQRFWWFNGPYTTKDLGLVLQPKDPTSEDRNTHQMKCEAIWFEFEFVPLAESFPSHIPPRSSYMSFDFHEARHGFDLFEQDIPELVKIVQRKIEAEGEFSSFIDTDFYALYEVWLDKHYDSDGGLDTVDVVPTLLGELDASKLQLALVNPKESQ